MFDRAGKDAIGRSRSGKRSAKGKRRPVMEALEGRALMTAGFETIADVTVPQYLGYQVPVTGTTTHQQTYTVTSDNPSVKASITTGRFLTIGVAHASSGAGDVDVNGTMTFQLFDDFAPITTAMITSLVEGTATNTTLTNGTPLNQDFYTNNGKNITRIQQFPNGQGYVIQGGANTITSSTGTTSVTSTFNTPFPNENTQSVAFTNPGQLAMANAGPDTNDSSFFITTGAPNTLNYAYTIWGQLVDGQDILNQLAQVKTTSSTTDPNAAPPVSPVTITSATVSNVGPDTNIHLDAGVAPLGASANITVTATDVTDSTTSSQTFKANVVADPTTPERPYIAQYDPTLSVGSGQSLQFQIDANSATPGDPLSYTVQGGVSNTTGTATFTPVDSTKIATAAVDANGLVTVVPVAGATGSTTLLVGVRDSTDRSGATTSTAATLNSPANYQYHTITLNFTGSATPVAQRPIAQQAFVTATAAAVTPIQLVGANPNTTNNTQPVTYTLGTQPTHGTIAGFNAATGALSYTPDANYSGPDAFTYTVTDPNTGQVSFPTTVKVNVANAVTGAVRFIPNDSNDLTSTTVPGTLVVTPLPRTDAGTNTIDVADVNGVVQVTVNGVVDATQISDTDVDRLVVYGSKASDHITVDPSLSTITTIDGGHGGKNVLTAGAGETREHGWFGTNKLVQGSSANYQLGREGIGNKFVKGTGTSDVIFLGRPGYFPRHLSKNKVLMVPTSGTYYKFAKDGKTLVPTASPYQTLNKQARQEFNAQQKAGRAGAKATGTAGSTNNGSSSTTGTQGTNGASGPIGAAD